MEGDKNIMFRVRRYVDKNRNRTREKMLYFWFEDEERRSFKECGQPIEAGKGKETEPSPEPLGEHNLANTSILAQVGPFQAFHQNCKQRKFVLQ